MKRLMELTAETAFGGSEHKVYINPRAVAFITPMGNYGSHVAVLGFMVPLRVRVLPEALNELIDAAIAESAIAKRLSDAAVTMNTAADALDDAQQHGFDAMHCEGLCHLAGELRTAADRAAR